jgi:hypothetical protein
MSSGVVQNTHRDQIVEDDFVQLIVPLSQAAPLVPGVVLFDINGDPDRVVAEAHRRMQSAEPGLPYIAVRPLDALVAPRLRSWRLGATMFSVFGALAVVLAAIGLYSVLAYDVAERRLELGVRSALGAATQRLALLVIGRGRAGCRGRHVDWGRDLAGVGVTRMRRYSSRRRRATRLCSSRWRLCC